MLFLRRPRKPLACSRTRFRRARLGTARGARDMDQPSLRVRHPALDALGFGGAHRRGAAQLTDLLVRALNHAVALARLAVLDLAGRGEPKALFGARFGLHFGHFASPWDAEVRSRFRVATACPYAGRPERTAGYREIGCEFKLACKSQAMVPRCWRSFRNITVAWRAGYSCRRSPL